MDSQQKSVPLRGSAPAKGRDTDPHAKGQLATDEERDREMDLCSLYAALEHEAITALAHGYWQERGRPEGSAAEDWFLAEQDFHNKTEFGYSSEYHLAGPVLRLPH